MLKRKRFDFKNVRTMTPETMVLGATVAEWKRLFTGNFVENLKLDLLRAELEKDSVAGECSKIERYDTVQEKNSAK
jgi:hypothetical protein